MASNASPIKNSLKILHALPKDINIPRALPGQVRPMQDIVRAGFVRGFLG